MSLKQQVKRLEKGFDRWYVEYIRGLSDEEYLTEFLRQLSIERGPFTIEEAEEQMLDMGGDLAYWRPLLLKVLEEQCDPVTGKRRTLVAREKRIRA